MTSAFSNFSHRARRSSWIVWVAGVGVYFFGLLHRTSLGVAGPYAIERLGISATELGSFVMLQLGLYAFMQVPSGLLIDRWGPRRVLLAATLIMGSAQILFAFSTNYPMALIARGLLGVGDAAVFIAVLRLAAMWFAHHRYAVLTMATGLVGMVGNLVATVPLVMVLGTVGWTTTFVVAGAASLAYSLMLLRPAVAAPFRGDQGPPATPTPMPARRMATDNIRGAWRRRETRLGFLTHMATMTSGTVISMIWGFPYLTQGLGYSEEAAASQLSIYVFGNLVASFLIGPIAGRYPAWRTAMGLGVASLAVTAVLVLVLWPGGYPPTAVVSMAFVALAAGIPGSQIGFHLARDYNPVARVSTATGLVNAGGYGGAMLASLIVGLILDLSSGGAATSLIDYRRALAALALINATSLLTMLVSALGLRSEVIGRIARGERVIVAATDRWWDRAYRRITRRQL